MADSTPSEPPPSYDAAVSSSSRPGASTGHTSSRLEVPGQGQSMPSEARRSMEDENRPLPKGFVRTFDPETQHQFYVDTRADPPRSMWNHPYDDDQYLSTLSSEERERIEQESLNRGHHTSKADIMAAHSEDDEDDEHHHNNTGELPPRPDKGKGKDNRTFGRKFKDKVTGSTHEEREQERRKRAEQERKMYEQHQRIRQAMAKAAQTGQPQLVGKDRDGKDLYIEPPGYSGRGGGYPGRGYGYDPYGQGSVYTTPQGRYIRPPNPYSRPAGYGYGGGYGLPLAAGLGGGLLGGVLLGDALGGGFGGFGL